MSTKKIATSTLWQIGSQVTMAAMSIVSVKCIALGLSKELAGNYNSAFSFLQLFGILADFGLYAVAVREVSKAKQRGEVLGALIAIRGIILTLSLLAAIAIAWSVPSWRSTPLAMGITIACLIPFFTLMAGIVRTVFQVTYKMHYVFIAEVAQRIFTTGALVLFIVAGVRGSNDLHIFHLFLFIGGIGAFILFFISLYYGNKLIKIRPTFNKELVVPLLKNAAPYGVAFLCLALYRNFDATLIALLRDDFELQNAYYGFVLRMVEMGYLLPTFLLNSTLPILSARYDKKEDTSKLLGKTFFIIMLLGSISCAFAFLWARPLVQLIMTDSYLSTYNRAGSDTALRLMAFPMLLNGVIVYSFYTLLTLNKWKKLVLSLLFAVVAAFVLNILLIPPYGFIGAGVTAIIVHILLACVLLPQSIAEMKMYLPLDHVSKWAAFSLLLVAGLWLFRPLLTNEIATIIGLIGATVLMGVLGLLCNLQSVLLDKNEN